MDDTISRGSDFLIVDHTDGRTEKVHIPAVMPNPLSIGRETDNNIVLGDPRISRHHAQVRRVSDGLEIIDSGSANGVIVDGKRIPVNSWQPFPSNRIIYVGDTGLRYEPGTDTASTLAMPPIKVKPADAPPQPQPAAADKSSSVTPWLIVGGALLLVLLIIAAAVLLIPGGQQGQQATIPTATAGSVSQVTPGAPPTTESGSGDQGSGSQQDDRIPYPVLWVESVSVKPTVLGGLPDPNQANIIVRVRVENQGTGDFTMSSDQFELQDASGIVLKEAGGSLSSQGLRKLGLADRYQNLRLRPGDNVPESLLFSGEAQAYDLFLKYQAPGLDPILLELGKIDAKREVAVALGTPLAEETEEGEAVASAKPTASLVPTPTPSRPAALPAPRTVPVSSLVGKIAYPVFGGETYDLYLGNADGSGNQFLLSAASQPQFSPDGQKIAYHSWRSDQRGLGIAGADGGGAYMISGAPEDQLPTWSPDAADIIFLSRRSGHRASELFQVSSQAGEPQFVGNGEYPTWDQSGPLVFKGWESTGIGLRLASPKDLTDFEVLTSDDTDTAPAVSPDGKRIVFMSKRDGNWNIYQVRSDGTGLEQLTDDPAEDGLPAWSPDGKVIAFVSNRGGPWSVWAMTPEGSGRRQLFTIEGSPDGFVFGGVSDESRGWAEERISWTK